MAGDGFERLTPRSLVDQVTERLEQAIIEGRLEPGQRLREKVVAAELGISRGPLREAIRRLEGRRLLERTAHVGVRVAALSPERLDHLLQVREALEGMAARLAAARVGAAELAALRACLDAYGGAVGEGAATDAPYVQPGSDTDFHVAIAEASGNALLTSMICGDLYDLLRVYRYRSATDGRRAAAAFAEHEAIYAALAAGDGDAAEAAMRRHLANARAATLRMMQEG